jgi:hypothetical protein
MIQPLSGLGDFSERDTQGSPALSGFGKSRRLPIREAFGERVFTGGKKERDNPGLICGTLVGVLNGWRTEEAGWGRKD